MGDGVGVGVGAGVGVGVGTGVGVLVGVGVAVRDLRGLVVRPRQRRGGRGACGLAGVRGEETRPGEVVAVDRSGRGGVGFAVPG